MSGFYEDFDVGVSRDFGSFLFTAASIVAFARAYDPQSFHLGDEAAAAGPFGRLAASGWHTAAVWMKLNVAQCDRDRADAAARGEAVAALGPSPGFKALKWLKPVYADSRIVFGATITGKRPTSRPGWGLVFHTGTGRGEDGDLVFSFEGCVFAELGSKHSKACLPNDNL